LTAARALKIRAYVRIPAEDFNAWSLLLCQKWQDAEQQHTGHQQSGECENAFLHNLSLPQLRDAGGHIRMLDT
jgi:hypothetical protein